MGLLDLNAIMFYKTKFTVTAEDEIEDLLWKIILHIRNWQLTKWNNNGKFILPTGYKDWTYLKNGSHVHFGDKSNSIYIESEYFVPEGGGGQYWACRIIEKRMPRPGYAPRQWITEMGYEQNQPNRAVFSCVRSYGDKPGFIGLCENTPRPAVLKLIQNILADRSLRCSCGADGLVPEPQKLGPGDWPQFWARLTGQERELPYIYISTRRTDGAMGEMEVDPAVLASLVYGNALVFYSDSHDFSNEMRQLCPERYACYGGAIRVYFPGLDVEKPEDHNRHRYLSAAYIGEHGRDCILQIFYRALAQNAHFYESFFRLDECREWKRADLRHRRMAQLQTLHNAQLHEVENQTMDIALAEEEKRLQVEERAAELQGQIEDLKRDYYRLSTQIENYQAAAAKNSELEKALESRFAVSRLPETPLDVMDYFTKAFGERIAFSEDAVKSAKDCTLDAAELWRVFFALATEMHGFFMRGGGNPFIEFKQLTGIDCARGEGAMTRKNKTLMRQFTTEYCGDIIDIEPHITFVRQKQSIHFGFSEKFQKIVVGHCGEHLKIYSTQKRK